MSNDVTIHDTEATESADLAIVLSQVPSITVTGLETFRERISQVEELFSGYADGAIEVSAKNLTQLKRERAWLRNVQKSADQKRKDAKAAYMAPVDEFAALLKSELEPVDRLIGDIDTAVKAYEEEERIAKAAEIREHFYEFGGFLADAIDYELVADPKWANRSVSTEKAKAELEAKLIRVKDELDALDMLSLDYATEAREEYVATLDFARAVSKNKELLERAERAAALKAEQDAYNAANQPELTEVAPPPTPEAEEPAAPAVAAPTAASGVNPADVERDWTIHVRTTRAGVENLAQIIKAAGYTGRITKE